jgi:hypothetical protein
MFQSLKKQWQSFLRSEPGRRFQDVHERRKAHRGGKKSGRMNLAFVIGIVLSVAGLALMLLPGPGTIVLAAGLILLAKESLTIARILDFTDKKRDEWTRRFQRAWRKWGTATRVALVASAGMLLVAAGAGVLWFFTK